jgi:hypothetical protein
MRSHFRRLAAASLATVALTAGAAAISTSTASAIISRPVYGQAFYPPQGFPECRATGDALVDHRFDYYTCTQQLGYVLLTGYLITG